MWLLYTVWSLVTVISCQRNILHFFRIQGSTPPKNISKILKHGIRQEEKKSLQGKGTLCAKPLKFLSRLFSKANDRVRISRERNIYFKIYASSESGVQVSGGWLYSVVSSCCFYPFSTACSLFPSSPFWHRMSVFTGYLQSFTPSSRSMKLVSRFLYGWGGGAPCH